MKTVVLKIGLSADGKYPIELAEFDDANARLLNPVKSGQLDPLPPNELNRIRELVLTKQEPTDEIPENGVALHKWIVENEVGAEWLQLDEAESLRTVLTIEDPELRAIPWELMCRGHLACFGRKNNPMVRGSLGIDQQLAEPIGWPLRILVVAGESQQSEAGKSIYTEAEVSGLLRVFKSNRGRVEPVVMWCPTREEFDEALNSLRPHIIHFIGHSRKSVQGTVLSVNSKPRWDWPIAAITQTFHYQAADWQPRLVFLNACRSSAEIEEQTHSWSVARAFLDAKIPAVLGMQADIRGDNAARFSTPFYKQLLQGDCIDVCVCEARRAVATLNNRHRDWCVPHLELNGLPEHVLPMAEIADTQLSYVNMIGTFNENSRFVDRELFRGKLRNQICNPCQSPLQRSLTVIQGGSEIGKSALLHYFLECCIYRGWNVAVADQKHGPRRNFLETLDSLALGDQHGDSGFTRDYSAEYSAEFADYLTSADHFRGLFDDSEKINTVSLWTPEMLHAAKKVVKAFGDAVTRVAEEKIFLLAIDHLRIVEDQYQALLISPLLSRVGGELTNVRVILATDSGGFDYAPTSLIPRNDIIDLTGFAKGDFERCVHEFFVEQDDIHKNETAQEVLNLLINNAKDGMGSHWKPQRLRTIEEAVTKCCHAVTGN